MMGFIDLFHNAEFWGLGGLGGDHLHLKRGLGQELLHPRAVIMKPPRSIFELPEFHDVRAEHRFAKVHGELRQLYFPAPLLALQTPHPIRLRGLAVNHEKFIKLD